jgi:diguanylate cyclase (GGDEF)-like protein
MIVTILSHIVAGLYLQRQKYNKLVTACFWAAYAILSACIILFCENAKYGFFGLFFAHAVVFFITTIGSMGEKLFLFLTYSNSFCICIGANLILSAFSDNSYYVFIYPIGIVILMHVFLYKFLLPSYKKSRDFFPSGWWKLNIVLVLFFIQFLNQYAFSVDTSNVRDVIFDFVIFSIIFYLTLILIFNLIRDSAEANKKTHENYKLKNIAYIDSLTNMQNRAAYESFTEKQVLNHRKNTGASFIFVILDINGFKNINDTKGHAEGDKILKQVSNVITNYFESYKCESFRFGGDEFVLLIEDIQLSYVENLIVKLNEELFKLNNTTLSHGCAEVDFDNAKPFLVALKTADAIMYSNKERYYLSLRNKGEA